MKSLCKISLHAISELFSSQCNINAFFTKKHYIRGCDAYIPIYLSSVTALYRITHQHWAAVFQKCILDDLCGALTNLVQSPTWSKFHGESYDLHYIFQLFAIHFCRSPKMLSSCSWLSNKKKTFFWWNWRCRNDW